MDNLASKGASMKLACSQSLICHRLEALELVNRAAGMSPSQDAEMVRENRSLHDALKLKAQSPLGKLDGLLFALPASCLHG